MHNTEWNSFWIVELISKMFCERQNYQCIAKKIISNLERRALMDIKHDAPDKVLAHKGPEPDCWNLA